MLGFESIQFGHDFYCFWLAPAVRYALARRQRSREDEAFPGVLGNKRTWLI